MKFILTILLSSISIVSCLAQYEAYSHVYPITEDPNVRYLSSYSPYETIRFEASPVVKFSFYNNFAKRLADTTKLHSMAQYLDFRPQFRMYTDYSKPIKTPCYRIFLGTQHMFRLQSKIPNSVQLIGFALQSGHFSNGQDKCTFAVDQYDGGPLCDSIYRHIDDNTDLSALLNRKNGNFSMNLTELTFNYRFNKINDQHYAKWTHSLSLAYVIYHKGLLGMVDIDLVSNADLKLLGRHRLQFAYEYMIAFKLARKSTIYQRIRLKQQVEAIFGAHKQINPIRTETSATFYPLSIVSSLGIVVSYIYGHDNYNYRTVDSGHQFSAGLTWDLFPPVKLKNG